MKRAAVIATGGTIASANHGLGASPDAASAADLLVSASDCLARLGFECSVLKPFGNAGLDSSDIGPAEWRALSSCVARELNEGAAGILVMHGTDTMAYTSAWLSLCFDGADAPIILTGSQRTQQDANFDGLYNLKDSTFAIANGASGVWICFNGKLFNGGWAHKAHATDFDAYVSYAGRPPIVARLKGCESGGAQRRTFNADYIEAAPCEVVCMSIQPGVTPMLSGNEKVLVISGFGAGNMPRIAHEYIERVYAGRAKPLVIACSQAERGVKAPLAYDGVGIGQLAAKGFSVWNQGARPLEFAVALAFYALSQKSVTPEDALSRYLEKIVIE